MARTLPTAVADLESTPKKSLFERCRAIDCFDIIQKDYHGAKYISWANAWKRLKENFPDASYEIYQFEGLPYLKTEVGYFVSIAVTIEGQKVTELLPVMDNKGNSTTSPTSRDISDNLKRCLVKAIALHGLGLECWEKEDIHAQTPISGEVKATTSNDFFKHTETPKIINSHDTCPFGKFKGFTVDKLPFHEWESYFQSLAKMAEKDGKGLSNLAREWWIKVTTYYQSALSEASEPALDTNDYPDIPF